ncbi:MAG: SMI1/KNR4 family protein [Deltaproteobacteria bacterium]|nr:SMI1/KNR4 family protein [Deltaproteobacteria bacterium]
MHRGVRRFIHWLETHRDAEGVALERPARSEEVAQLEHQIGMPIPADLRLALSHFNGGSTPAGTLLPAGSGPGTIEAVLRELAGREDADFLDPELLLPFHRTLEGSLLAFDRSAGPVSDTWPIVDYDEESGEQRLVHRTFDGFCEKCVADWTAPDFELEFTLDSYLLQGQRHAEVEPDVASAHATVAHALRRSGRPEDAMESYLRAAACVPPLSWCAWEALKIAALLLRREEGFEAASRLASRAPQAAWARRETTPLRVAELVVMLAAGDPEPAPYVHLLDLLLEAAWGDQVAAVGALRATLKQGDPLPAPRPPESPSGLEPGSDPAASWALAEAAYHAGSLRDEHLLFEPQLAALGAIHPLGDLLRIRRDF